MTKPPAKGSVPGSASPASQPPATGADEKPAQLKVRVAWATCVHEAGHAILAIALGYHLVFSDVSEALEFLADVAAPASWFPRTGFTRIVQVGTGHTPAISFAVAGRAAEAVHDLIDDLGPGQTFDVHRWRESPWGEDDDLKDAYEKALAEVGGSEPKAWVRVEREYQHTVSLLGRRAFRGAALEIASILMRIGRAQAEAIVRIANRWGITPNSGD